jgi:hypothetical protein
VIVLDVLPAPLMAGYMLLIAFPFVGTGMLIANYLKKGKGPRRNRRKK